MKDKINRGMRGHKRGEGAETDGENEKDTLGITTRQT